MNEIKDYIPLVDIDTPNSGLGTPIRDAMDILNNGYDDNISIELPISGDDFNQHANLAYLSDGKFVRVYPNTTEATIGAGNLYLVSNGADGDMKRGIFARFNIKLNASLAASFPVAPTEDHRLWLASDGSISYEPSSIDNEAIILIGAWEASSRILAIFPQIIICN